jgi:hypothetical protein
MLKALLRGIPEPIECMRGVEQSAQRAADNRVDVEVEEGATGPDPLEMRCHGIAVQHSLLQSTRRCVGVELDAIQEAGSPCGPLEKVERGGIDGYVNLIDCLRPLRGAEIEGA